MSREGNILGFSASETRVLKKLNTPAKVQDFLDALPINFEERGETLMSPRRVLREKKAHCMEGALFAASAFWLHGGRPLLLDLKTGHWNDDQDHVVALFRERGRWGAVSKTNHAVLRYREPVYKTVREIALSYFHEYFLDDGRKTLEGYSRPFDLRKFLNKKWTVVEDDLWYIADALDDSPHASILPRGVWHRHLRRADAVEIQAGKITEWKPKKRAIRLILGD